MKLKKSIKTTINYLPWLLLGFLVLPVIYLRNKKSIKKVIIFPQSKIGDFIAQTPLFRELKTACPQLCITVVLVNPALKALIRHDPSIDEIIIWHEKAPKIKKLKILFKLMKNRYDWSFNLSIQNWLDFIVLYALIPHRVTLSFQLLGPVLKFFYRIFNTKSVSYPKGAYSTEVYLSMLKFMGIKPKNSERKLYLCVEDEKMVEDLLERYELRDKKYLIGISISCGNRLKKWSEERFALLADRILDGGKAEVILTGTNDEKKDAERFFSQLKHKAIFLFGVLNLGQFAALCNKLSLFVSVDSGPLYIANAVGTPVIDIAGPCDIKEQLLLSSHTKVVQPDLPCIPCSHVIATARSCQLGTRECIKKTTVENVFQKIKEIIPDIEDG